MEWHGQTAQSVLKAKLRWHSLQHTFLVGLGVMLVVVGNNSVFHPVFHHGVAASNTFHGVFGAVFLLAFQLA